MKLAGVFRFFGNFLYIICAYVVNFLSAETKAQGFKKANLYICIIIILHFDYKHSAMFKAQRNLN